MVFPIGDDNRDRKTVPYVNYLLIALNIFVYVYWQGLGRNDNFTLAFSTIPAEVLSGQDITTKSGLGITPQPVQLTLITSMFMHGGLAHLLGNMLYLWIFGDNVEDALGHVKYLFFYLLCGVLASLSHVFSTVVFGGGMYVPSLGASGAISAILGAYLRLYPGKSVHLWIFFLIISVPAFISVGIWFAFQVVNGLGALGGQEAGGVAYAAHIGGFVFGLLLIGTFAKGFIARRRAAKNRNRWI
ncbi:rhomboid family intramembrane serine protease [Niastella sp. OAS944]|uniref:rhomboid family intramembrane serine protease n=1 Tax=Niastella sp. OAS944 TaxID=2664089 RepID=UPI003473B7FE|nr:membrane associated rhomboid family serine protease [Chitinophagaceae bacterium OAS944]